MLPPMACVGGAAGEPVCPRVSQLELSRVNSASGVNNRYATGISTAIGRNASGWTRSHGGSWRTDGDRLSA